MNSYGNKYGYHTPEVTQRIFERLEKSGLPCVDLSWHHDEGDSIMVDNRATIWFPNNKTYNHYGYVPYLVVAGEEGALVENYDWENEKIFKTEEELIEFLLDKKHG